MIGWGVISKIVFLFSGAYYEAMLLKYWYNWNEIIFVFIMDVITINK